MQYLLLSAAWFLPGQWRKLDSTGLFYSCIRLCRSPDSSCSNDLYWSLSVQTLLYSVELYWTRPYPDFTELYSKLCWSVWLSSWTWQELRWTLQNFTAVYWTGFGRQLVFLCKFMLDSTEDHQSTFQMHLSSVSMWTLMLFLLYFNTNCSQWSDPSLRKRTMLWLVLLVSGTEKTHSPPKNGMWRRALTLVGLRGLGDVDGELTAEWVHSHHPRVSGGAGERRQLVVTARDAVEGLGEIGRSLQDDLLQTGERRKVNHMLVIVGLSKSGFYPLRTESVKKVLQVKHWNFRGLTHWPVVNPNSATRQQHQY